jgi:hypothetical protein
VTSPNEQHSHDGGVDLVIPVSAWAIVRGLALGAVVAGVGYSLYLGYKYSETSPIEERLEDMRLQQRIQDRRMAVIARQEIARFVTEASELADVPDEETKSDEDKVL